MIKAKITHALVTAGATIPFIAFAQVTGGSTGFGIQNVIDILKTIAEWIFAIFLIIAIIMVLYAAFKYLTSGGDPGKVQEASKMLVFAAVAIGVALLAGSIEFVVRELVFGGAGGGPSPIVQ